MKKKYWKSIVIAVIAVIAVLGIATFVEIIGFEWKTVRSPRTEHVYSLQDATETENPIEGRDHYLAAGETISETDDYSEHSYEQPVFYRFDFPSEFLNRLQIKLKEPLEAEDFRNIDYTVIVNTASTYGEDKYTWLDDSASCLLGCGITELRDVSKSVYIELEQEDAERIESITFANRFVFNYERWLLFVALIGALAVMIVFRKFLMERLELVFLILAMTFGISILFSHGITPLCWDEQIHFSCIYQMSYPGDVPQTESYTAYTTLQLPRGNTIEEHELLSAWADTRNDTGAAVYAPKNYPHTTVFGRVGYIFEAVSMFLARLFGAGFSACIYISNFVNLLMYVVVVTVAVRLAAFGKRAMFFIAMMPVPLLLATAFSYDAFTNAFLLLGFAILSREYADPQKLNYKRMAVCAAAFALGVIPKAVYFPLAFLPAFLPKEKYRSKKERNIYWLLLLVLALALAATFVLPTILAGSGGADLYSDPRRATANVSAQLSLILHHPVKYAKLLFTNIFSWQLPWYLGMKSWTNFVYSGMYTGTGTYLIPVVLTFLAITQGSVDFPESDQEAGANSGKKEISGTGIMPSFTRLKVGAVILSLISQMTIWSAMYLAFNPVGAERIKGVQGRYLFPFVWLVILLFVNKRIVCRLSQRTYNMIISGFAAFITFLTCYMIYWSGMWMNVI